MSTRDKIEEAVKALLKQIEDAAYDYDVCELARLDCAKLCAAINAALLTFNKFEGWGDGGPTREDQEGTVTHDIG